MEQKTWRLGIRQSEESIHDLSADGTDCPVYQARRLGLHGRIHAALDQLPEEQRLVFVLRSIEGLSLSDIASIVDCPANTVRSRKILAVKKLRYLLSSVLDPEARKGYSIHS